MARPKTTFRVSTGILEHVATIGPALGVFLWLIDAQTGCDRRVLGGKPIQASAIAAAIRCHQNSVKRHLAHLRGTYIETRRAPNGLIIRLVKNHKWPVADGGKCRSKGCRNCRQGSTNTGASRSTNTGASDTPELVHHSGEGSTKSELGKHQDRSIRSTKNGACNKTGQLTVQDKGPAAGASARRDLTDWLIGSWKTSEREAHEPGWDQTDYVQLARRVKQFGEAVVRERWPRFLADTSDFYRGHRLRIFCAHIDRWNRPEGTPSGELPAHCQRDPYGDGD